MATCSGCGERDGGIGHGKTHSRTGLARVGGDVGSVADVRRQVSRTEKAQSGLQGQGGPGN